MQRAARIFIVFFMMIALSGVVTSTVFAQATDSAVAAVPVAQTADQQIQALREQYRQQLLEYRDNERLFTIAKEQNTKLKTLASLEDAVRSTRKAMVSRVTVLRSYFGLVRLTLTETTGLDLAVKDARMAQLKKLEDQLKAHQLKVEASADRTSLQAVATEYAALQPSITDAAFRSISLIAYGDLQTVFDKARAVRDEAKQLIEQSETNQLRLSEKQRGFAELDRTMTGVEEKLQKQRTQLARTDDQYSEGSYNYVVNQMSEVYANLSQSIDLLRESVK